LVRDSLNENSYAPKAKIQAFGPDCAQSALAFGNPDCHRCDRSNPQLCIEKIEGQHDRPFLRGPVSKLRLKFLFTRLNRTLRANC